MWKRLPVTVNLLHPVQPDTLDGNYETLVMFQQLNRNMYDGLFRFDDTINVQPALATGYEQPDSLTYDITLRKALFSTMARPSARRTCCQHSIAFPTIRSWPPSRKPYINNVESVTALSDYKVRFKLKKPDASFVRVLAFDYHHYAQAVIEKLGNAEFGRNPVGTGPFKFERWNQGDSVVLKANCDYWGEKPIPSEVEFRFISEPATQISSLQSGEIDIATDVTPRSSAGLASSPNVAVRTVSGNKTVFVSLNTLEGPLADKRVRQALNYAVDKQAIADQLYAGLAKPLGQMYAPSVFGYSKSVEPYPYDPERAKQLLAEAGYNKDNPLRLDYINDVLSMAPPGKASPPT